MSVDRKYIIKQVATYQALLGLIGWKIRVGWNTQSMDAYADCKSEPEYLKANINFNLDRVTTKKLAKQCTIHELIHVVLSPLTERAQKLSSTKEADLLSSLEETTVTNIEKWPLWKLL